MAGLSEDYRFSRIIGSQVRNVGRSRLGKVSPPSTSNVLPVRSRPPERPNTTAAAAMSTGSPSRRSGVASFHRRTQFRRYGYHLQCRGCGTRRDRIPDAWAQVQRQPGVVGQWPCGAVAAKPPRRQPAHGGADAITLPPPECSSINGAAATSAQAEPTLKAKASARSLVEVLAALAWCHNVADDELPESSTA